VDRVVPAIKYDSQGGGGEVATTLPFMMTGLECDGTETSMERCDFDGWNAVECASKKAAAVVCSTQPTGMEHEHQSCRVSQSALTFAVFH
jgi:hypothetical protein